jgi:hypothetical protein
MNFFMGIVRWLLGIWLSKPPAETQEAVQAGKAAAAETELKIVETTNAQVQAASVARDAVSGRFTSAAGLRAVEQSDPNNRDNG